MVTDYGYGTGMDTVIKQHAEYESSYMYVFEYKSWTDELPWCYGQLTCQYLMIKICVQKV